MAKSGLLAAACRSGFTSVDEPRKSAVVAPELMSVQKKLNVAPDCTPVSSQYVFHGNVEPVGVIDCVRAGRGNIDRHSFVGVRP